MRNPRISFYTLLAVMLLFLIPVVAQAANVSTYSAADMLKHISEQVPSLTRLVTALAYVMGMYFIFLGVLRLKHAGEMRTMMSHEHSMKAPLIYLGIGAMLLYLPSSVQMGLSTFWAEPNPYGYIDESDQWMEFFNACFMIVQLVGIIAFIRGLVMLSQLAGHGGGQGGFAKGMMHIIGGIFCINIYQFVQVVMVTLGLEVTF